jgi:hypothetical protein
MTYPPPQQVLLQLVEVFGAPAFVNNILPSVIALLKSPNVTPPLPPKLTPPPHGQPPTARAAASALVENMRRFGSAVLLHNLVRPLMRTPPLSRAPDALNVLAALARDVGAEFATTTIFPHALDLLRRGGSDAAKFDALSFLMGLLRTVRPDAVRWGGVGCH